MSIDHETLRRILRDEAEQRGLEMRGSELVGAASDLEAVVAAVAGRLGRHLEPADVAGGLIRQGRLNVERLASLLAPLDVDAEASPVERCLPTKDGRRPTLPATPAAAIPC